MDFRHHIRTMARGQKILEIGPSYEPIFPKGVGHDVMAMDHADQDELIRKYTAFGVDTSKIGEVDFVTTDLSEVAQIGALFDIVVASHVIEHTTDIIRFFSDCEKVLTENGKVVLIVPDKRFSFDFFRPLSSAGNMIDAHVSGRSRHIGALFDHYSYFCRRDLEMAWSKTDSFDPEFIHTTELSRSALNKVLESDEYEDAHEWVFTPNSFRFVISELRRGGFAKFGIDAIYPTVGFEFLAILSQAAPQDQRPKKEQLFAIESDMLEIAQRRELAR